MATVETKIRDVIVRHGGSEKQFEFWNSECMYRLFVGGVGSGKSRAGAVECLRMPPDAPGMIVAPTYKMLSDPTMETFFEIADSLIVKHNKTDKKITLCDGKKILYRSADEPDSLRGPNLGWAWLDEASLMEFYAWQIMVGRLRRIPGKMWATTTPKGYDWVWELFEDQENVPDPQNYHMVRCSSDANIFLPADYVTALHSAYSGAFLAQEVGGEFTEWGKHQTYQFNRGINCEEGLREQYRKDLPLILCCDFNYLIKPWPVLQVVNGHPRVIGEIVGRGVETEENAQAFRDEFPDHLADLIMYGDRSGKSKNTQTVRTDYQCILAALKGYSASAIRMRVPGNNPPPRDRINSLNRLLRGDEMAGIPMLKIDPEWAPFLCKDLVQCHWNKAGTDVEKVTDPEKKEAEWSHATDALGYWAWREFPFNAPKRPKPGDTRVGMSGGRPPKAKKLDWSKVAGGVA